MSYLSKLRRNARGFTQKFEDPLDGDAPLHISWIHLSDYIMAAIVMLPSCLPGPGATNAILG